MNNSIFQILARTMFRERYKHLDIMKKSEYKSISECRELQKNYLYNILNYSLENIPYYKEFNRTNDIKISIDTIFEDIKKLPILTKATLRNNFDNLKSENFKRKYFKNTTGGSTGEPVLFLQDLFYNECMKASKILFYEWAGRKDGEKMIKLWGSERDILTGSQGFGGWINEKLLNIKLLNSFRMSEDDMRKYVDIINKKRPQVIEAYVQSIYELAKFIKNNNLIVYFPNGIITTAGTLYPEQQRLIEEVFKTKVYNRYGSREVGDAACSCEKGEGLHLNIFDQYIEILNDELKPCKAGEIGQVYVTTLNNHIMPLIRYQIGDMAVPAKKEQCSCGRGLPLIKKIVGRQMDVFKTENGKVIPGEFFIHFIGVVYNKNFISKFQVVQKDYAFVLIRLVLKDEAKFNLYKKKIVASIKDVMGKECKIEFEFVDDIEPTKSGKYLYTICEVE